LTPPFLSRLLEEMFRGYYHGFVGSRFTADVPVSWDVLTSRRVEEMDVDRHMEESLRVADQAQMTDAELLEFLANRGYSRREAESPKRGIQDITIYSGLHLGAFSQRISLPELIEFLSAASSLCIAGRYRSEKYARPLERDHPVWGNRSGSVLREPSHPRAAEGSR
jgi:hypothetical protein